MQILKRNGSEENYNLEKIANAIRKAFLSVDKNISKTELKKLTDQVEKEVKLFSSPVSVETVQDTAEKVLMVAGYYDVSKSYILYRNDRSKKREIRRYIKAEISDYPQLDGILLDIEKEFLQEVYGLDKLKAKFNAFLKSDMNAHEKLDILIKSAVELTTADAPKWEFIGARLLYLKLTQRIESRLQKDNINNFYDKINYLTGKNLYGKYILDNYSKEEIVQAEQLIVSDRNKLFNYSGLDLLINRYLIVDFAHNTIEDPQEMFLGIALHLAMLEKDNRLGWVKRFYDMLSTLKVTMATPTLSNARKPFHQLSSCFIDTVPDSLTGIYRSITNFAQVSKFGGGMGLYFGKVRAQGGTIRGFEGAAGGIVRWIKLANDTAVAVDQLGVRQGAVAVYLDVWHKDLPEFLALRTNNGDDRMKAHDVFPAICYPNLFWKIARESLDADWYLMCPHEILTVKGYSLEDSFGKEWEEKYWDCVKDPNISKRTVQMKDIVRLILKSAIETGTPFAFNRDIVNEANPNSNSGIIYSSNLCTEIAQNMSGIEEVSEVIETVDGDTVVINTTKPGDFVVCNLASLSLGIIDLEAEDELEYITESAIRALDNVIDLNFFPVPYAKINNEKYRPIGLGVSGYHHMLAKRQIAWESEAHLEFADKVFERINYGAISASCKNAIEKGRYSMFEGSDWQTGKYFSKRDYNSEKWLKLKEKVAEKGIRNGWLLAVAPTSSTSIIAGTTAGVDPVMNRFFLEEKKNGLIPRVAPELTQDTLWFYKSAHTIDQNWSVMAAGVRARHIDQAQSMNFYITNDFTFRQVLNLYILAFERGVKSIYYIRSKSLEIDDCEVCSS